jgi:UDP-N-acetylmuramoyl-L-alanyl-D-glutamate--2,6-diaminopimelate ligase
VRHADVAVFTEEDSRSEDPELILEQLAEGARRAGGAEGTFAVVPDRREAIRQAVALAEPGDLILLAGKGHETTLERRSETLPWDEVAEAKAALERQGM